MRARHPDERGLRVLAVTNQWPSAERPQRVLVARQVDALRRAGVEVDVLRIDGYASRSNYARALLEVGRLHRGPRRYDIVHAHTGHCGVVACAQLRYPVVLSYVGYDLDGASADELGGPSDRIRAAFERAVFRRLSHVVAATVTKSVRGELLLPPQGRRRNTVIPGGIDRDVFAPIARAEARRRLGWPADAPTVLFAADPARFSKRFELAEAAVERARLEVPDLSLVVAARVEPQDMPTWMSAADVLLLTSRGEGSPNVVKEAMACDLPVVSVDVGDVAELVSGTRHCRVCDANAVELAAALVAVARALPERSDGRERSAALALEVVTARMIEVYRRAASRGPGPLGFVRLARAGRDRNGFTRG